MKRLEQESTLLGVAGKNQSRDLLKCPLCLLIAPRASRLWSGCKTNDPAGVAVAAPDLTFARVGEDPLDTSAEKLKVE
jgi:hypothetical protein